MNFQLKIIVTVAVLAILGYYVYNKDNDASSQFQGIVNINEQPYVKNIANLTSTFELNDYFTAQSAIYIENVYPMYVKCLGEMLDRFLPKSKRYGNIEKLVKSLNEVLREQDYYQKVQKFKYFAKKNHAEFKQLFEFNQMDTLLSAGEFKKLLNKVELSKILEYANVIQLEGFVDHIGAGIRAYLVYNRSKIDQETMLKFKAVVDEFLHAAEFLQKLDRIDVFLNTSKELLE